MKKLQIPVEDELMKKVKQFALDNDMTLRELVTKALENHIAPVETVAKMKNVYGMLFPEYYTVELSPGDMVRFEKIFETIFKMNEQMRSQRRRLNNETTASRMSIEITKNDGTKDV